MKVITHKYEKQFGGKKLVDLCSVHQLLNEVIVSLGIKLNGIYEDLFYDPHSETKRAEVLIYQQTRNTLIELRNLIVLPEVAPAPDAQTFVEPEESDKKGAPA